MSNVIVFYDIPSTLPGKSWSPNTWKARYALNIKNLPYKTVWVEYPDIQALYTKLSLKPTSTRPNGDPYYTLPVIYDPSTNVTISDSFDIIVYLDEQYPGTKRLVPEGTKALQIAFESAESVISAPLFYTLSHPAHGILNPESQEYFYRTKGLANIDPPSPKILVDALKKYENGMGTVISWLKGSKYVSGDTITFTDLVLAVTLLFLKRLFGEESEEWKEVLSWHDGRWGALMDELKQFEVVQS